ncbi:MAG: AMP-binding protein [Candidatus Tectomicrobia bacterium]|nr:AMP-binding protein [Candidatus Tectomicrobia bacterium]
MVSLSYGASPALLQEQEIGLVRNAERTPDKPAIIYRDHPLAWREFNRALNRVAHAFRDAGLRPGEHVALLLGNCPEYLITVHGLGKLNALSVLVNYRLKAREIAYVVSNAEARGLVYGSAFHEQVSAALPHLPQLDPRLIVHVSEREGGAGRSFAEFTGGASDAEPDWPIRTPVSNTMIYTSGTTGLPKGVLRRNSYPLRKFIDAAKLFNLTRDERHLCHCPLYHSAPMSWANNTLYLGGTVILQPLPRFDAEEMLRLIAAYRVTTTTTVPTVLNACVRLPAERRARYRNDSFKLLLTGGAPCPLALKRRVIEHFGEGVLHEYYGSTETGMNTILYPHEQFRGEGCCGRPMPGNDLKILDEDRNELPPGEVGAIYMKNFQLLDAYYNEPETTAAAFHGDYFTLGDVGYLDAAGYLYVVDRSQDMLLSGGVNIYPAEIEKVLAGHPGVQDVAVIGVPDDYWGEVVWAVVVPAPAWRPDPQDLINYCADRLADYKKPRGVDFVEALPYNPSGKVLKQELRARYGAGLPPAAPPCPAGRG